MQYNRPKQKQKAVVFADYHCLFPFNHKKV